MSFRGRGKRFHGHNYGGRGGGGSGGGGGGRRYFDDDNSTFDGGDRPRQRPPPGLKGKEIGLWFARRSRAKKEMLDKQQRPVVKMNSRQERNIRNLLENFGSENSSDSNDSKPQWTSGAVSENSNRQKPVDWFDVKAEDDFRKVDSLSENAFGEDKASNQETEESIVPSMSEMRSFVQEENDFDIDMNCYVDTNFQGEKDLIMDAQLTQEYKDKMKNQKYQKMLQARKKLPAYNMKDKIVDLVQTHQVVVISGETGCGKTTQVPQFILDDFLERGIGSQCRVVCTQPRRISAISVAQRVADERIVRCGQAGEVGFQIRLERELCREQGSILFCTTGIVLKWLESDPLLMRASHVILDEIHERDLLSDFLMIIIKTILVERPELKVILMSATLNAEMFSNYFGNCPIINIPGFTYPVKEFFLEDVLEFTQFVPAQAKRLNRSIRGREQAKKDEMERQKILNWIEESVRGNYSASTCQSLATMDHKVLDIDLVVELIKYICLHKKEGAILVFLTGWEDIRKVNDLLLKRHFNNRQFKIIPLHSLMPTVNQREVFDRPPTGVRKIVLATNIAETSITIDDIVYVIDCGKIKMKNFEPDKNLTSLEPQMVSKANSRQRRGRAGRVQPGECYHLYTTLTESQLMDYLPPEMLRTRLEELCLQIKLLKLGKIVPFVSKAIQPPSMEALHLAIEILQNLNALDRAENLLPLGKHLARMPVDPHSGKMILLGAMFSCLDPILTVAASLSFKDAFVIPLGKEKEADHQRKLLAKGSKSDHIMLINAYKGWEKAVACGYDRDYCWDNFLSPNTLKLLKEMKKQFASLVHDLGFIKVANPLHQEANVNSDNENLIRAIICAGLYPNVAKIHKPPKGSRPAILHTKTDGRVQLHPKSVNSTEQHFEMKWLIFHQKLKTSGVFVHDCSMVSPYPLLFFGGHINIQKDGDQDCITVDNWIIFQASPNTAKLVKDLRKELDRLLDEKIKHPGSISWNNNCKEGAIMKAITDLITQDCPTDTM